MHTYVRNDKLIVPKYARVRVRRNHFAWLNDAIRVQTFVFPGFLAVCWPVSLTLAKSDLRP